MNIGQISEGEGDSLEMTMKEETGFWRTTELFHMREDVSAEREGELSRRKNKYKRRKG